MEKDMLKKALNLVGGPLEQFWKNIYGEEGDIWFEQMKKYLRKEPTWLPLKCDFENLEFKDCLTLPASPGLFYPKKYIKNSRFPKIFIMDDLQVLLDNTRELRDNRRPLRIYDWHRKYIPSLSNLAAVSPSSFQDIWYLLQKQLNGQEGSLSVYYHVEKNEIKPNIFFIEDIGHNIRPITLIYNQYGWTLNFLVKPISQNCEEFRIFLR